MGTDGGLFEKPVEVKDIVLTTGERVELLVRGTDAPGTKSVLQNLPYDRYAPQTQASRLADDPRSADAARRPMSRRCAPVAIPAALREVVPLDTAKATAVRTIVFGQGMINGKLMDMAPRRCQHQGRRDGDLGDREHRRNGPPVPSARLSIPGARPRRRARAVPRWKDMLNIPKHSTARIIVRYDDYPGKWMFHCHILDHEDHGMMGVLEVK